MSRRSRVPSARPSGPRGTRRTRRPLPGPARPRRLERGDGPGFPHDSPMLAPSAASPVRVGVANRLGCARGVTAPQPLFAGPQHDPPPWQWPHTLANGLAHSLFLVPTAIAMIHLNVVVVRVRPALQNRHAWPAFLAISLIKWRLPGGATEALLHAQSAEFSEASTTAPKRRQIRCSKQVEHTQFSFP